MSARTPVTTGSASGLTPATGAIMQKNAFGLDVLQRPFTCPRNGAKTLVPSRGTKDIFYSNLFATGNYSITENEGLQCLISVEYKGLLNGALPEPLVSSGIGTGSTSATSGDDGAAEDQRTWEIVFYSPTRTFRYITNGKPSGPKFSSYSGGPVSGPSIQSQSIRDGNGKPRGSAPGISLTPKAVLTGLTATPVPGTPYFEVEETWSGLFVMSS